MSDEARIKATVYVGGLSHEVDASVLHDAFLPFGEIADITIPKPDLPSNTDPHRGFGYIEFEFPEDAREAMDNMDQSELFGRVIKVTQAKPKKAINEGLGSKIAVWEQEGYAAKHHVSEDDRRALEQARVGPVEGEDVRMDPMQGLEGLDVAGPKDR